MRSRDKSFGKYILDTRLPQYYFSCVGRHSAAQAPPNRSHDEQGEQDGEVQQDAA